MHQRNNIPSNSPEAVETIRNRFAAQLSQCPNVAFQAALKVLRQQQDAEDVAQQALARAFQNYHRLRDPDRFPRWLARISRRLAFNYYRSHRACLLPEASRQNAIITVTGIDALLERERAHRLRKSIARLPEKLRIVTVLVALQEQRVRDVAQMLHVTEGTVKKQLFVARQRLRILLRP